MILVELTVTKIERVVGLGARYAYEVTASAHGASPASFSFVTEDHPDFVVGSDVTVHLIKGWDWEGRVTEGDPAS